MGKNSLSMVAEKHNMTGGNLRHWILKYGYSPRRRNETKIDEKNVNECCKLYIKGFSNKDLSIKFGVSRRTILEWIKRGGLKAKKFNETLGINEQKKEEARRLYKEELLNCSEIANVLNVSSRSVFDWIKTFKRTQSEIAVIKILKNGSINSRGRKGVLNTKYGKIHYDSLYERDRIIQLCEDKNVLLIKRCIDRIPYIDGKFYLPDLEITYNDKVVVEEIKPKIMLSKMNNPIKFKSANEYYIKKNITYRIITEKEIYSDYNGRPNYNN